MYMMPLVRYPTNMERTTLAVTGVALATVFSFASVDLRQDANAMAAKPYTEADKVMTLSPADQRRVGSVLVACGAGAALGGAAFLGLRVARRPEDWGDPAPVRR